MRSADLTAAARIRDSAIALWGQHGFGLGLRAIADAAGVSAALVIHHFGSKDGLQKACDDYVAEQIRTAKSESLRAADPATWFRQMAEIETYAPMMAYLCHESCSVSGEIYVAGGGRFSRIAESVVTLDHITHGRLDVGVAIGYRERELEAAGLARKDRVPKLEESLLLVDVDLRDAESSHARRLFLQHRRPELYAEWTRAEGTRAGG